MQKYNCVQFTLRPRGGILEEDITSVGTFIGKWCQYAHVITEKEGIERHVHCALILKESATMNSFNKKARRAFQYIADQDRGLLKVLYKGGPWYNEDWYVKYLAKGDSTELIMSNMCSKEERESLYVDIPPEEQRRSQTADPYLAKLERLWIEDGQSLCRNVATGEINVRNSCVRISRWISKKCFKDRVLRVIYDERRMRRTVKMLCCYIAKGDIDYMYGMTRDGVSDVHGPPLATRQCESCTQAYAAATGYGHDNRYC